MRFELGGTQESLRPLVFVFEHSETFDIYPYKAMGYKFLDGIAIGGGGGFGGGTYGEDTEHPGTYVRTFGGAGGGGGYIRLKALLSALPDSLDIVVGQAGADGVGSFEVEPFDPDDTTDGGDGGYSWFGLPYITGMGGLGGKRSVSRSRSISSEADGAGGGGTGYFTPGGGAGPGGQAGTIDGLGSVTPPTPGPSGGLSTSSYGVATGVDEGRGGAGGPGGIESVDPGAPPSNGITRIPAAAGGNGSWRQDNEGIYGEGTGPRDDLQTGAIGVLPGIAGGARITPLNGSWHMYGSTGKSGVVAIRLTAV